MNAEEAGLNTGPVNLSDTVLGPATDALVQKLGDRCLNRYKEYLLTNFYRRFVFTGNDSCFFIHGVASDELAGELIEKTCSSYHSTRCDSLIINADVPQLGIRFEPAHIHIEELESDPDLQHFGPTGARGAIVWIPGRSMVEGRSVQIKSAKSPNYLREFNNHTWDVFHYYPPPSTSADQDEAAIFAKFDAAVGDLKRQGYRKILLAGHSWGASIALYRAHKLDSIDGVIATSPGFSRHDPPIKSDTDEGLYVLLASAKALSNARLRVAIVMLDGDEFNPHARLRAVIVGSAFRSSGVPTLVISPAVTTITGHDGAEGLDFAIKFATCIRDFLESDSRPAEDVCATSR